MLPPTTGLSCTVAYAGGSSYTFDTALLASPSVGVGIATDDVFLHNHNYEGRVVTKSSLSN